MRRKILRDHGYELRANLIRLIESEKQNPNYEEALRVVMWITG